jgi:hypothetical protein
MASFPHVLYSAGVLLVCNMCCFFGFSPYSVMCPVRLVVSPSRVLLGRPSVMFGGGFTHFWVVLLFWFRSAQYIGLWRIL